MAATPRETIEENRGKLVAYFESGITRDEGPQHLGVEVEHFIVADGTLEPVCYEPHDGLPGVRDVLAYLEQFYPDATYNPKGDLLGLANETGSVTLEPAAQLEISLAPYSHISDIEASYAAFHNHVTSYLEGLGCHIAAYGYHPSAKALDLPLIPKSRYRFMNEHFSRIGTHGERMMRTSASTQVSIDYYSEADAVRKLRVATAIGPVLAFVCDNLPVFEGRPNTAPLTRLNLWREVDNDRCGAIPGVFQEGFGFGAYADWLLRTSPIFVTRPDASDPDGPSLRPVGDTPAAEAYSDAPMTQADVEHLISMFWPDVRLKRFVEIRQADSMPAPQVCGYAALIKGLFYSEGSLASIERLIGVDDGIWPLDDSSVNRAISAIRADGGKAEVYGTPLTTWVDTLFQLAGDALDAQAGEAGASESRYLAALREWKRIPVSS